MYLCLYKLIICNVIYFYLHMYKYISFLTPNENSYITIITPSLHPEIFFENMPLVL